jgi:hypothetical protein
MLTVCMSAEEGLGGIPETANRALNSQRQQKSVQRGGLKIL